MGQANHNPRSSQHKGPLPEFAVDAKAHVALETNATFRERMAQLKLEAGLAGSPLIEPKPKDVDIDVVVTPLVAFVVPLRTATQHPAAVVPQPQIRIPLVELKKQAMKLFRDQGHIGIEGLVKLDDAET